MTCCCRGHSILSQLGERATYSHSHEIFNWNCPTHSGLKSEKMYNCNLRRRGFKGIKLSITFLHFYCPVQTTYSNNSWIIMALFFAAAYYVMLLLRTLYFFRWWTAILCCPSFPKRSGWRHFGPCWRSSPRSKSSRRRWKKNLQKISIKK